MRNTDKQTLRSSIAVVPISCIRCCLTYALHIRGSLDTDARIASQYLLHWAIVNTIVFLYTANEVVDWDNPVHCSISLYHHFSFRFLHPKTTSQTFFLTFTFKFEIKHDSTPTLSGDESHIECLFSRDIQCSLGLPESLDSTNRQPFPCCTQC